MANIFLMQPLKRECLLLVSMIYQLKLATCLNFEFSFINQEHYLRCSILILTFSESVLKPPLCCCLHN